MKTWSSIKSWSEQDEARLRVRNKCFYACVLLLCLAMLGFGAIYEQPAVWVSGFVLSFALCVQMACVWYFSPREGRVSTCPTPTTL